MMNDMDTNILQPGQNLFNALKDVCDFTALETDMMDILQAVEKDNQSKLKNNGDLGDVVGQSEQLPDDLNYHDPLDDADDPRTVGLSNG